MKPFLVVAFFLCCTNLVYTQIVFISVYDTYNELINDIQICKNDSINYVPYVDNKYLLFVKPNDKITIKHSWYNDTTFQILETINSNDTIFKTIFLIPKAKNIDEVIITHPKYKLLSDVENEFIIDYYPLPKDNILLLARTGKYYYLKIINENQEKLNIIHLIRKPEKLFLDPFGNFHLISKDSVNQIWLTDSEFKLMNTYSYSEFQKKILNMVAVDSDNIFYKNTSKHNQLFVIDVFNKSNGKKTIYESFDKITYKNAVELYNEIIYTYNSYTPDYLNIIKLGLWNGNISQLGETSGLLQKIVWYSNVISRPINTYAFGMLNEMVVIDGFKKQLSVIDYQNFSINSIDIKFDCTGNFYYDYFFDEVYTYSKKGKIIVNKIDLNTGKLYSSIELSDILLPKNIKILNGWVYFLLLDESGYNKLLKTR